MRTAAAALLAAALTAACSGDTPSADAPTTTDAPMATDAPTTTDTSVVDTTAPSTSTSTSTSRSFDEATITHGRLGPLRIGMTLEQAEEATGLELHVAEPDLGPGCALWSAAGREDLDLLALDGRLARITVDDTFATSEGIRVGDVRRDVIAAYGEERITERTNEYGIPQLLVAPASPDVHELLFQLDPRTDDHVQHIDTGTADALRLDEGCA